MTTRQPKGIPVGGQFASTGHSEPDVALAQPTYTEYTAPIVGDLKLRLSSYEQLPEWPANLPEPNVFFDFDEGKVSTYVNVEGGIYPMRFWEDDVDGIMSSSDNGGDNPWEGFDEEDQADARAWAKEVHQRIDGSTFTVMQEATTRGKVREMILAHATGQVVEEAAKPKLSKYEQLRDRADQKFVAAQKALRDQDRLSMAALSAGLIREFPTATELRVTQKREKDGIVFGHRMSTVRDGDGNILVQGDEDARLHSRPGDRGLWNRFHDIRKDFFESKHPDMGFGFFDYDQETREIIVPLDRDYTEGIED